MDAMAGDATPPRSNGELVFDEPWHARVFGLAVGIAEEQGLDWEHFRTRLIEEIGAWEREHATSPRMVYSYYELWAAALERLVIETGLVSARELENEIRCTAAEDAHDHVHTDDEER
jgi:nitrile hydratase accessory protein